jgi:hypothetical protein
MVIPNEFYLPSTTCKSALNEPGIPSSSGNAVFLQCEYSSAIAADVRRVVKSAVISVTGRHATIRLADDLVCERDAVLIGSSAARLDKTMRVSHWIERGRRWLFDDRPTGAYSPAGRKSATLLRASVTGGTITAIFTGLPQPNEADISLCSNGTSHIHFLGNFIPNGGAWYVAGGFSGSRIGEVPGPPVDAHGNPQGEFMVMTPIAFEWSLKLAGGTVDVSLPPTLPGDPTAFTGSVAFQPGNAGC